MPLRILLLIAALLALHPGAAAADSYAQLSLGLPEVVQLEAGYQGPEWSVGARAGFVIFNAAAGLAVTRYVGHGRPGRMPRHSLLLGGHAMINVGEPGLRGGGETIASYLGLRSGYAFAAESGFLFRAELGLVAYVQNSGPEAGPLAALSVGWRF